MVGERRLGPLMVCVALALCVTLLRLGQIQLGEHDVWAREAANLVRSSSIVPYHRGRILDARGRVIVRDEDTYEVELVYRGFRRGHPLGQVAHAWSSLTLHPEPLDDALLDLVELAHELVSITPAELDAFARGAGLERLGVPASADPERDLCARRASDVRYYLGELLGTPRVVAWRGQPEWTMTWVELACRAPTGELREGAVAARLAELAARMRAVPRELERLAGLLAEEGGFLSERDAGAAGRAADAPLGTPLEMLVDELEALRRDVEDDAADELFLQATGFEPGRVTTATLGSIDLDWIALLLRWDAARLDGWIASRRVAWQARLDDWLARVAVDVSLAGSRQPGVLLDHVARLWARPEPGRRLAALAGGWRALEEPIVLSELDGLFAADARRSAPPLSFLALFDQGLRARSDDWQLVARVLSGAADVDAHAAAWEELVNGDEWLVEPEQTELGDALHAIEERFQPLVERAVLERLAAAGDAQATPARRLALAPARLERARERERYVLKDRSSRPFLLPGRPSYDVVHLLARNEDRYRGFAVRDATRRVFLQHNADGTPFAKDLIGHVRQPGLEEILGQRSSERELHRLRRKAERTDDEQRRIVELTGRLVRDDEMQGGGGIESYFDEELRGRNGYREIDGLQERADAEGGFFQPPRDGLDLVLTLDLDLQAAALDALAHPRWPPDEPYLDELWVQNPVGAIVLATPDGAVLAAASEPTSGHDAPEARLQQRAFPLERTLRKITFNPPGSVFKPFVAAWALEYQELTPDTTYDCVMLEDGSYGYGSMHCSGLHGTVDLHAALRSSCNAYFAQVGELLYTPRGMARMADAFGFGRATGVKTFGEGTGRTGLVEQAELGKPLEQSTVRAHDRMRAANGLTVVEATPMQVARATAGIATGRLPEMRLVESIGGELLPLAPALELEVGEAHLELVRRALRAVVSEPRGSAYGKGLDEASLGFSVALKTGSADFLPFEPGTDPRFGAASERSGRMRKHTWIAGWFPAEDPRAVFVVYLHDSAETSSHTAVHVARQFLSDPAVGAWLAEQERRQ